MTTIALKKQFSEYAIVQTHNPKNSSFEQLDQL